MKSLAVYGILGAVLTLGFSSCGGKNDVEDTSSGFYETQFPDEVVAGGHGPSYEEPIPITEGDYFPPDFDHEAETDRLNAVLSRPQTYFDGEIGGFDIIPLGSERNVSNEPRCDVTSFPLIEKIKFGYFPPGTSVSTPQYAGVCPDATVLFVAQSFITQRGSFHGPI